MRTSTYGTVYGLWCLCHPMDGIRYVGQTTQPLHSRLARHKAAATRVAALNQRPHHSQRWILKHGAENICASELDVAIDKADLNRLERHWITQFENLTNQLSGGLDRVAPGAKVTESQVHAIRALADRFVPQRAIAERYGIDIASVSNIARRRTWKHVAEAEPPLDPDAWIDSILVQLT